MTVKAELATRAAAEDGQAVLAAAKEQELLVVDPDEGALETFASYFDAK